MNLKLVPLWGWTILLMGVVIISLAFMVRHERDAHFDASLRADSALAVADSSKRVNDAKVQKVLGDSTVAWQRRIIQEHQRSDSLDNVLGSTRVALANAGITIDRGNGRASGTVRVVSVPDTGTSRARSESTATRKAHFDVKAGVFGVAADVQLPAPPSLGTMEASVTAPKIPLSIRFACGSVTDGVRRADAIVTGPRWATIGIDHVEAEPAMCNPTLKLTKREYPLWFVVTTDLLSAAGGYWLGSRSNHVTVNTK